MFNIGDRAWRVIHSPSGTKDGLRMSMFEPIWDENSPLNFLKIHDRPRISQASIQDVMKHKRGFFGPVSSYSYLLNNTWVSTPEIYKTKEEAEKAAEELFQEYLERQKQAMRERIKIEENRLNNFKLILRNLEDLPAFFMTNRIEIDKPLTTSHLEWGRHLIDTLSATLSKWRAAQRQRKDS